MKKEIAFLHTITNLQLKFNNGLQNFIDTNHSLSSSYQEHNDRKTELGFNLFSLISDTYKRENFHSDILSSLLNPQEKHNEKNRYLELFLKFLNNSERQIEISDFQNAVVQREKGKIDISICDKNSKKAIIIENKINGAIDTNRQIPRYYDYLEESGYSVIAVLYLTLSDIKDPDKSDWSDNDKNNLQDKIICRPAYLYSDDNDLYKGWILKCEKVTSNINALFVLRQYGELLEFLGGKQMNKPIMEKFYNNIIERDNFKTALSLIQMIDDLVEYRLENIFDKYYGKNIYPFDTIRKRNTKLEIDIYSVGQCKFGIDIVAEIDKYKFQFWDKSNREKEIILSETKEFLEKIGLFDDFYPAENYYYERMFKFPEEEIILTNFIDQFINKLKPANNG